MDLHNSNVCCSRANCIMYFVRKSAGVIVWVENGISTFCGTAVLLKNMLLFRCGYLVDIFMNNINLWIQRKHLPILVTEDKFQAVNYKSLCWKACICYCELVNFPILNDFYDEFTGDANKCGFGVFRKYCIWKCVKIWKTCVHQRTVTFSNNCCYYMANT